MFFVLGGFYAAPNLFSINYHRTTVKKMARYYKTGNLSHKKGEGIYSKRGRPRKEHKATRHFTALDAARCVAYARRDGADDALLAKYLIYSMGAGAVPCLMSQWFNLAKDAILIGVVLRLIKGINYLVSGLRLLFAESRAVAVGEFFSDIAYFLKSTFGIDIALGITEAEFLITVGGIQAGLAAIVLFFDNLAKNIIYFRFGEKVCEKKIDANPFRITPKELFSNDDINTVKRELGYE